MKNFKNVFFLAAIAVVSMVFVSCDKDDDGTDIESGSFDGQIKATVSTGSVAVDSVKAFVWIYGDESNEDVSFEVANGKYENGGFTLNLLTTVPAQYLEPFSDEELPASIKVSDPKAKSAVFSDIEAFKGANRIGDFEYGLVINDSTDIETLFIYVDRDVTVTGSYTEEYEYETYTETYNVSLKKGWNKVYVKDTESISNKTYKSESTTAEPSGLKWFFDDYSDYYRSIAQTKAPKFVEKKKASSIFK